MTDVQIAKLTGMETYCRLSDQDSKRFPPRLECSDYPDFSNRNQISALALDNIPMKKIKRHLIRAVKGGRVSPLIKNLVHSSCSHDSIALSKKDLLIWTLITVLIVITVIWVTLHDGILDFVLDTNYRHNMIVI